jgi:predicted metal-dependent peptidase
MDEKQISELLNHAFDYWINGYLLEEAKAGSTIADWVNSENNFSGLYDPNLVPKLLTQQEIVKKLAEEAKISKQELTDTSGNSFGNITTININGRSTTTVTINSGSCSCSDGDQSGSGGENIQDIVEVMENTKNDLLSKTKGSAAQSLFEKIGVSYDVPTDWFRYLKSSVFNVAQRYTNNHDQTWSKLKNKFRHVASLPGRIYYEKQLAVVISIDQSGSMSNADLEKINYVVSELGKQTIFTEILLHDSVVAERQRFYGKKFLGIREFITTRAACGGTSHKEVFHILNEIKKENPKYKLLYISFSDNYSDIEEVYDPEIFRNVISYWITTDENRSVNVPGMQISLEHGLLQI